MKQITSPKYIYKINSNRLADSGYNLYLKDEEEMILNNVIALFDNQVFRFIDEIENINITYDYEKDKLISNHVYKDKIIEVVFESEKHFDYVVKNGFMVNGKKFKRLFGTAGGIKKNTVIFVEENLHEKLYPKIECDRDKSKHLVPSKVESYMSLTFSNSIKVTQPTKVTVLPDAISKVFEDIIHITDRGKDGEPLKEPIVEEMINYENEVNISDGCGLISLNLLKTWSKETQSINYDDNGNEIECEILGGCCIRNAYTKGMVYPFDWGRWIDEYNDGNSICKDVWGNEVDLNDCDLILTEGMLKLWDSYKSMDDYREKCKKNGFEYSVCKIVEPEIEDTRRLNYQYLQSFEFTDEQIEELISESVRILNNCMGANYYPTLKFLGIKRDTPPNKLEQFGFAEALAINSKLLNDKYTLKAIDKMIKKKINELKIGKILVEGNYQMASGDPVCILERAFDKPVKGFLGRRQFYSSYWYDKKVNEVLIMRSPMTCHNNIIKGEIVLDEKIADWYKYMKNVLIFNAHDNTMSAENGED